MPSLAFSITVVVADVIQVVFVAVRKENGNSGTEIVHAVACVDQIIHRKRLDANRYATKKTLAQGMLDIALLTANASQLKYVLQVGEEKHPFFYLLLVLIISSIVLQASVGVLFLIIGGLNINKEPNQKRANILNDVIVVLIFLITLDNVVISGFGIRHTDMNVNPERL
ncbi:ninjurin-2-like isoform X3 [Tigriopus californicus]|uniref:ninjurin-2-like isoform X3 n=1 Tax=Tigriopus californicus TaxID=6832 RepID=UPI0027DA4050|nr:ninjurin-2-like isoform X3 [Tigriopus californicus]